MEDSHVRQKPSEFFLVKQYSRGNVYEILDNAKVTVSG